MLLSGETSHTVADTFLCMMSSVGPYLCCGTAS